MTNYRVDVQSKSGEWINYATNLKEPLEYCKEMAEFALSDAYGFDYDCDNYNRARVIDNGTGKIVLDIKEH